MSFHLSGKHHRNNATQWKKINGNYPSVYIWIKKTLIVKMERHLLTQSL